MTNKQPVRTISGFRELDDDEILMGYMDGHSGLPLAPGGTSRSYLHGWRNGLIESGRRCADQAYLELQRAFELRRLANGVISVQ